jgi:large subunit ribosomal protein L24
MSTKIRKGDEVEVVSGKERSARGRVLQVLPKKKKVLVEGVNQVTRHEKVRPATGRAGQTGGIVHKEAPIDLSNVALVCPTDGATRAGYRVDPTGVKVRVCKKCGTEL